MVDPTGATAHLLGVDVQTAVWALFSLFSGWFLLNTAVPEDGEVRAGQWAWQQRGWQGSGSTCIRHAPDQESLHRNRDMENLMYQQVLFSVLFLKRCEPNSSGSGSERLRAMRYTAHQLLAVALFCFPFSLVLGQAGGGPKSKMPLPRKDMREGWKTRQMRKGPLVA